MLVEDDSFVSPPRLAKELGRFDERMPLQLGEFYGSEAFDFPKASARGIFVSNESHWRRPFACGGAGTVFSRAAVLATDFGSCAEQFNWTCLQSDWMIGRCAARASTRTIETIASRVGACACWRRCAERYAVTAIVELGCGACGSGSSPSRSALLERALISGNCAFIQVS